MSSPFQKIQIVKLFASSEYKMRNRAYKSIIRILKFDFGVEKKQLTTNDILAIWKGLYVWLWMQDKPILHEEVVDKICSLLAQVAAEKVGMEFIRGFFITMTREWSKIDVHRLDKFYMLVRQFFAASLRWMDQRSWANLDEFVAILQGSLFCPPVCKGSLGGGGGIGLRMHFADIALDELTKANVPSSATTPLVTELILSQRVVHYQQAYLRRVRQRVIDRLQSMNECGQIQIDLSRISTSLLEAASSEDCVMRSGMRKSFYGLAKQWFRHDRSPLESTVAQVTISATEDVPTTVEAETVLMEVDMETAAETVLPELSTPSTVVLDTEKSQSPPEVVNSSPMASVTKSAAAPTPKRPRKKERVSQSMKSPDNAAVMASPGSHSDDQRRVTFGKKYTKKFSKGTASVTVSQGTVRQQNVRSILKHK